MNDLKYLYAIYDITDNKVIYNSRGSAYKNNEAVCRKMRRLIKLNPGHEYYMLAWKLEGMYPIKMLERFGMMEV